MKKKHSKKEKEELVKGTLRVHPRGFGFLVPEDAEKFPEDIFIPRHLTDNAVDGDTVEVCINPDSNWEKGPDGKVISILKRGRTHLCATVHHIDSKGRCIAFSPLLGKDKQVVIEATDKISFQIGQRLILKVIEWGGEKEETLCAFSHLLGHISDPSCDVPAAIEEFDLPSSFSKKALKEAKAYGESVRKEDLEGREDLTKLVTFTIDPETAKDFDDALSLTQDKQGNYHLGVHIADAAYYVRPKSALDEEAFKRCNSTYFPGRCLPMLPEELSTHLCSLRADVIRLTASVLMVLDKNGNLQSSRIVRSYIKSRRRYTYQEAMQIIEGTKKSPHRKTLLLMEKLCLALKKKRYERGSIDFSLPETVIELDEKGAPIGLKTIQYDITHQLVEEFMLKANELVAKHLSDIGKQLLYRIHEEPSPENTQEFFSLARSLGFNLSKEPAVEEIQAMFHAAKETPHGQQLAVAFIRSMKLAYYSPDNVGHFGLALEHYSHFTSPIRRYNDLVIQRLLFDEEEKVDLEKIALKCSEQERISFRAETSVKMLKKLRLLQKYLKDDPEKQMPAIVTRIKPFGISFELSDLMLEGFLHVSDLEDDYFVFNPQRSLLVGKSSGKVHVAGEKILVKVSSVDLILLDCKWELVCKKRRTKR